MLKILYKDGSKDEQEGKIDFVIGSEYQTFEINNIPYYKINNLKPIKIVYDTITSKFVYYGYRSYGFHYKDYDKFYQQSLRELSLEKQFKKWYQIFIDAQQVEIEDIPELFACFEDEIKPIYNN
jgi:hypothetical protein